MPNLTPEDMEKNGAAFDEKGMIEARRRCWDALNDVARRIEVGMLESRAFELANQVLLDSGAARNWHRSQVRFGCNTLRSFGESPVPEVRLQANDLFFLDLGPIYDGHEGDCGATFVVGDDSAMRRCADDAREIHKLVRDRWFDSGETGGALYEFARGEAERRGWLMTFKSADGHRLGDFPHALHFKGKLANVPFRPTAYRWVLEIQIRHPEREFGAFFEDILF